MISHQWKPIEDLPENWQELASPGLESLASVWLEQSEKLTASEGYGEFKDRLCREWAIETGILERIYSIDRGITLVLIEKGIEAALMPHGSTDKPAEEIVAIIRDHQDALEGLYDFVSHKRELTTSYIKELHAALTRHQQTVCGINPLGNRAETAILRGEWKKLPNNPSREDGSIHEYCPPVHVASEMEKLVGLHQEHERLGVPPEIAAAWLHHRFTQIHPFQDGNGRVARALASLVFLRARWFPLVIVGSGEDRETYIRALETADANDLGPLVELFATVQRCAFRSALSISDAVLTGREPMEQIVDAAVERLRQRRAAASEERELQVLVRSQRLQDAAFGFLSGNADRLSTALGQVDPKFWAVVHRSSDESRYWFVPQTAQIAQELRYFADTATHSAWVRLSIQEEDRTTEIVFSFHALGVNATEVGAVVAFIQHRFPSGDAGGPGVDEPYRICSEVFEFAYNEPGDAALKRFYKWLNETLTMGLEMWRRQL